MLEKPDNLVFLGRISDSDMKTLLGSCKAFLFPTLYEGFGIPPLEAMACGAVSVVSDTPTMHEVYGGSVYYIDPYNADVDLEQVMSEPLAEPGRPLEKYSWEDSAKRLYELMKRDR